MYTHESDALYAWYNCAQPLLMLKTTSKKRRPDHPRPRTGYSGNPSCVIRTATLCSSAAPLDEHKVHTSMRKQSLLRNTRFSTLELQLICVKKASHDNSRTSVSFFLTSSLVFLVLSLCLSLISFRICLRLPSPSLWASSS
jgi:hypothetical protein